MTLQASKEKEKYPLMHVIKLKNINEAEDKNIMFNVIKQAIIRNQLISIQFKFLTTGSTFYN